MGQDVSIPETRLACGYNSSLFLSADGVRRQCYCVVFTVVQVWGWGRRGAAAGCGDWCRELGLTAVQVTGLCRAGQYSAVQVSAGAAHWLALTSAGLYSWGDNRFGQCGLGSGLLRVPGPRQVHQQLGYKTRHT